jgi:hypothetical protein
LFLLGGFCWISIRHGVVWEGTATLFRHHLLLLLLLTTILMLKFFVTRCKGMIELKIWLDFLYLTWGKLITSIFFYWRGMGTGIFRATYQAKFITVHNTWYLDINFVWKWGFLIILKFVLELVQLIIINQFC